MPQRSASSARGSSGKRKKPTSPPSDFEPPPPPPLPPPAAAAVEPAVAPPLVEVHCTRIVTRPGSLRHMIRVPREWTTIHGGLTSKQLHRFLNRSARAASLCFCAGTIVLDVALRKLAQPDSDDSDGGTALTVGKLVYQCLVALRKDSAPEIPAVCKALKEVYPGKRRAFSFPKQMATYIRDHVVKVDLLLYCGDTFWTHIGHAVKAMAAIRKLHLTANDRDRIVSVLRRDEGAAIPDDHAKHEAMQRIVDDLNRELPSLRDVAAEEKEKRNSLSVALLVAVTDARIRLLKLADERQYGLDQMRRFTVVPHFDFKRQFVTVDTDVVKTWIRSVVKTGPIETDESEGAGSIPSALAEEPPASGSEKEERMKELLASVRVGDVLDLGQKGLKKCSVLPASFKTDGLQVRVPLTYAYVRKGRLSAPKTNDKGELVPPPGSSAANPHKDRANPDIPSVDAERFGREPAGLYKAEAFTKASGARTRVSVIKDQHLEKAEVTRIVVIDPGCTNVLTGIVLERGEDGEWKETGETIGLSRGAYYHATGGRQAVFRGRKYYKDAKNKERIGRHAAQKRRHGWRPVELDKVYNKLSNDGSMKVGTLEEAMKAAKVRIEALLGTSEHMPIEAFFGTATLAVVMALFGETGQSCIEALLGEAAEVCAEPLFGKIERWSFGPGAVSQRFWRDRRKASALDQLVQDIVSPKRSQATTVKIKKRRRKSQKQRTQAAKQRQKEAAPAKPEETVVAFGHWFGRRAMKGEMPAPIRTLRRAIAKRCRTVIVDESYTSCTCHRCGKKVTHPTMKRCLSHKRLRTKNERLKKQGKLPLPEPKKGEPFYEHRVVHGLSFCPKCKVMWSRDVNAAQNIAEALKMSLAGKPRPGHLQRQAPCDASTDA